MCRGPYLHLVLQHWDLLRVRGAELPAHGGVAERRGEGQLQVAGGKLQNEQPAPGQGPQCGPETLVGVLVRQRGRDGDSVREKTRKGGKKMNENLYK